MNRGNHRRTLHIGVLMIGAYLLLMGVGTLVGELGAIVLLGEREWITFVRAVMGAVFTALGILAVWDAVRDLRPGKKEEKPSPLQVIFTDTAAVCSSIVTPERIHEQAAMVSQETGHIALQPVTPVPVAELGELVNLTYAPMEDGCFLAAVFRQDGGVRVLRKSAGVVEAEAVFLALTEGRAPDFANWEPLEASVRRQEAQPRRRLLLYRDNGISDHEFFTERDLDLAVTGLADGTYQKALVQNGPASIVATPGADGDICLCLSIQTPDGPRSRQRTGTPNQARFWLVQFYTDSQ